MARGRVLPVVQLAIGRSPSNFCVYCPARSRELIEPEAGAAAALGARPLGVAELAPQVLGQATKGSVTPRDSAEGGAGVAQQRAGPRTAPAGRGSSKFLTLLSFLGIRVAQERTDKNRCLTRPRGAFCKAGEISGTVRGWWQERGRQLEEIKSPGVELGRALGPRGVSF